MSSLLVQKAIEVEKSLTNNYFESCLHFSVKILGLGKFRFRSFFAFKNVYA